MARPIVILLTAAALAQACVRPTPPDPNMSAIHARFGAAQLTWLTRRIAGGQAVICGYAGPPRHAQVFIARSGKVFVPADLPDGVFDTWEDALCGDTWIKPLNL
jgi:hypothetical protein